MFYVSDIVCSWQHPCQKSYGYSCMGSGLVLLFYPTDLCICFHLLWLCTITWNQVYYCINFSWGYVIKCLFIPDTATATDQNMTYNSPMSLLGTFTEHSWEVSYRNVGDSKTPSPTCIMEPPFKSIFCFLYNPVSSLMTCKLWSSDPLPCKGMLNTPLLLLS